MAKIGRNEICPLCNSGEKYKKCHLRMQEKEQYENRSSLFERFSNAPIYVRVSSSEGQPVEMTVSNMSVTKNGVKNNLLKEELSVSIGSVNGEKTQESLASLNITQQEEALGEIRTSGNASISNNSGHYSMFIAAISKKKIESVGGLFAKVKIKKQYNGEPFFDYFDVVCGTKAKDQHSHITFYPDGNCKFIAFRTEKCRLESKLCYDAAGKNIFPSKAIIHFDDFSEILTLTFNFDKTKKTVTLNEAIFSGI
jgi:hypothetical protein